MLARIQAHGVINESQGFIVMKKYGISLLDLFSIDKALTLNGRRGYSWPIVRFIFLEMVRTQK